MQACWPGFGSYSSSRDFSWDHFTQRANPLDELLNLTFGQSHALSVVFPNLFERVNWGQNPADAAEFTSILLNWGCSHHLTAAWERRYNAEGKTNCHDSGTAATPVVLQHVDQSAHTHTRVQSLITQSTQELGMVAAFLPQPSGDPTSLVRCQVDRMTEVLDGQQVQHIKHGFTVAFDGLCMLPFFMDSSADVLWRPFVAAGFLIHMGSAKSGHYQAAARFHTESLDDELWFLSNDGVELQPVADTRLPAWMLQNVTTVWMCAAVAAAQRSRPLGHDQS